MLRKMKKQVVPLPDEGFIEMSGSMLPKHVLFEALGSAGPFEQRQKEQLQIQAIIQAANLNELVKAEGGQGMNLEEAQQRILRIGDVPDIHELTTASPAISQGVAGGPEVPGPLQLLAGGGVG